MSTALGWLLAGIGVLLWPRDRGAPARSTAGPAVRENSVAGVAAVATVALCMMLVGAGRGLAVAVVVCPGVLLVLRRLAARPARVAADPSLPLALDLAAAVLRSGRPVADALARAAPAARAPTAAALQRTARLLELGAEPAAAWAGGDATTPSAESAVLAPVAEVAVRSHTSGVRLADAFERLAVELRAERAAAAATRAERAGVQAMGPLAACFLPSFVCLGIVPVIAGIATTVLDSVR